MAERETQRGHEPGTTNGSSTRSRRSSNPVLALQRSIGNRAVVQVLAREPTATGTVQIGGVGTIKVKGGNLGDWTGKESYDTVDVTSQKGKHSAKLEKLATAGTKGPVKVMIAPGYGAGEDLNVGGGTQLEIADARVEAYSVGSDGVETWRLGHFERVRRAKITHTIGAG
jgi:hypothetical protein